MARNLKKPSWVASSGSKMVNRRKPFRGGFSIGNPLLPASSSTLGSVAKVQFYSRYSGSVEASGRQSRSLKKTVQNVDMLNE